MILEFKPMSAIEPAEYIALHTDPLVRKHMPLIGDDFGEKECIEWIKGKEKQWQEYGYGPWAFVVDGRFAGWGGLQYEAGDADLGLVLRPDFWGMGKVIAIEILRRAFGEMGLESVTVLFPPSRKRIRGLMRLGFLLDGETQIDGELFIRYRLVRSRATGILDTSKNTMET